MAGKSPVTATYAQDTAPKALAHRADRAEADRARALLLTLYGWTSETAGRASGSRERSGCATIRRNFGSSV